MKEKIILLVEDDLNDVELAIRALRKSNITSEIKVLHDGKEAIDYLFGEGEYKERDTSILPAVILLDLKMPRIGGLEVLHRIRQDKRTKDVSVIIFTSSKEEEDMIDSYSLGANIYLRKPLDSTHFNKVAKQLGWATLVGLSKDDTN
ncbi:MAG: response regulator [bacterium]